MNFQKLHSSQRLTNLRHYGIEPILSQTFLTGFHFSQIKLNDRNPRCLITLRIKMRE